MMKPRASFLTCLCLMLSGCICPDPKVITVPRTQILTPPASLMRPCPEPGFSGETVGDMVRYIEALQLTLIECDGRMSAQRAWSESVSKSGE